MDKKKLSFSIQKIDLIKENDKSFLGVKLWAISEGLNRNNVDFTPPSIKKAIPTVKNKPILAAFNKSKDEFEAHNDLGVKKDEDTGEEYVDYDSSFFDKLAEKAIGTIPSESIVQVEEYDDKNWLTFNGLIWVKYNHKAVKLLKKLGQQKVSVEVTITDYEETDDGILIVHEFIFDGVTIIGVEEGIEGANVKVGKFVHDFSLSSAFNKFEKELVFAYNEKNKKPSNDVGKEDNERMKFDFKGMTLNTFNRKIYEILFEFTFDRKYEDDDGREYSYQCQKYWIEDIDPDNNLVILQDCEETKLYSIPFYIDDERNVVLEWDKKVLVEINYYETSKGTKVNFAEHKVSVEDNKNVSKGDKTKMDVKFAERFVEKGFTPICKFDKYVLFTKSEDVGKLYKLEFETIEQIVEENFEEVISKFVAFEEKEEQKEEMVSKKEFEEVKALQESLKAQLEQKDVEIKEKEAKMNETNAKFLEVQEKCNCLEKELSEMKEKCSQYETEKFTIKVNEYVNKFKENFENEEDFIKSINSKVESKEIVNELQLKNFIAEQLFAKVEKETSSKPKIVNSNLNTVKNVAQGSKEGNNIFAKM